MTTEPDNNLSVRVDTDGVWLVFKASTGSECMLLMQPDRFTRSDIAKRALNQWVEDRCADVQGAR